MEGRKEGRNERNERVDLKEEGEEGRKEVVEGSSGRK
jgi:hypothetical protein